MISWYLTVKCQRKFWVNKVAVQNEFLLHLLFSDWFLNVFVVNVIFRNQNIGLMESEAERLLKRSPVIIIFWCRSAGCERSERRVSFVTPEESSDCWTGLRAEGNGSVNDDEWREARWRTALCGDLISRSGVSVCLVPLRQTAGHIIESSRHSLPSADPLVPLPVALRSIKPSV